MLVEPIVQPAYLWVPDHSTSAGKDAADLAAAAGLILEPEQRLVLDAMLAEQADGRWAAFEVAVTCARRNGKTWGIIAAVLADLFLFGADTVVWSAHEFKTAMEAFRDIKKIVSGSEFLMSRVKNRRFNESNGDEGFELVTGQRMMFKARTKSGGRGLGGDRVVLDEAFALTPAMMGSLMPLMGDRSMTGNPQMVYASSAGKADADVWRGVRDRGRAGGDPSLAYVEWCAPVRDCLDDWCDHKPPVNGCVLDDREMWRIANPGIGRRISLDYVATERRALEPAEFARERLGWWEEPSTAQAGLPLDLWEACKGPAGGDALAFAVDVTPDFSWSAIAKASQGPSGVVVEVVRHERGTAWVAQAVAELAAGKPVVVDLRGPAGVLQADLNVVGVDPIVASARDVAQACGSFVDGLVRRSLTHTGQPELDAAVRGASRRPLGEAWAWSRKSSATDISPLVAVTLAAWGAQQRQAPEADFYVI